MDEAKDRTGSMRKAVRQMTDEAQEKDRTIHWLRFYVRVLGGACVVLLLVFAGTLLYRGH